MNKIMSEQEPQKTPDNPIDVGGSPINDDNNTIGDDNSKGTRLA